MLKKLCLVTLLLLPSVVFAGNDNNALCGNEQIYKIKLTFKSNIKNSVKVATDAGDFRFIAVYGYTTEFPGVKNFYKNYKNYGYRVIDCTSDSFKNKEMRDFNVTAIKYAEKYNKILMGIIKRKEQFK